MASTKEPAPGSDFMEDFYAECDDYLVEIRRSLLKLEDQVGNVVLDRDCVEKIFRSFHSLKGICGMAGLGEAEKLAHRAEDYLRALSRNEVVLDEAGFDILTIVTQKLEEIIVAHRQGQPALDTGELLERISQVAHLHPGQGPEAPRPSVTAYPAAVLTRIQSARQHGQSVFVALFRPSPELASRGNNVGSIRNRLGGLGEILYGAPKVQRGAELTFEFVIAAQGPPALTDDWLADGVEFLPYGLPADAPAAGVSEPSPASPGNSFVAPSHFLRVDLSRLDELMRIMSELVIHRARLDEVLGRVGSEINSNESRRLQEITHGFSRELRHLRDGLMRVRMVPIGEVFERLPFVVRDLSRETGKKVKLAVKGQETELDKYLVERLKEPLLHLVRNAISHGAEPTGARIARGKTEETNITVQACAAGETILIEVSDDGAGVDPEIVSERARAHGLEVSHKPSAEEILDLLCSPGFSTREAADRGAGRGIGMAAVKNAIIDLGGQLELESNVGVGSTFRLQLPLTLAVADALIVSAGGQRFAMPQASVQEITTAEERGINRVEHNELLRYRNGVLPLLRLTDTFGLKSEPRKEFPVIVVGSGLNALGIVADRILGSREIVVRAVKDPLLKVPGISGATELGDGEAVLILDSTSLAQSARQGRRRAAAIPTHTSRRFP